MISRRYSKNITTRIANADPENLGVALGKLCVLHGYSVTEVAEVFKVCRPTVYNWFCGRSKPSKHLQGKVQALVSKLNQKPISTENE